jgi:hypothetical protein
VGQGGSIGVGRVARAAPDGYTIDIGQWDTHVGGIIYSLNYDLRKDFEPIGLMSINPLLMVGKKNLPAEDLTGLVAWMKANPGRVTFVVSTAAAQLTGIMLQQMTGAWSRPQHQKRTCWSHMHAGLVRAFSPELQAITMSNSSAWWPCTRHRIAVSAPRKFLWHPSVPASPSETRQPPRFEPASSKSLQKDKSIFPTLNRRSRGKCAISHV